MITIGYEDANNCTEKKSLNDERGKDSLRSEGGGEGRGRGRRERGGRAER